MRTEDDLRAALASLEAEAPDARAVQSASRDGQRRTVRRWRGTVRRWRAPGLIAAAAVTAAAVLAIVATSGGSAPPVISGGPTPAVFRLPPGSTGLPGGTRQPARQVLLAAAVKAAQAPPTSGRYWEISSIDGNFMLVGPDDDPYVILERAREDTWIEPRARSAEAAVQSLGVQLGSARDRAPWRRAGSPTTWPVSLTTGLAGTGGLSEGGGYGVLPDVPGRLHMVFAESGGATFTFGAQTMTTQQLLALPADPAQLRILLLNGDRWKQWRDGNAASFLFDTVPAAIQQPVTDAVRTALYQLLAGLPGVQSLGRVRDAAGQVGDAIALTAQHQQCGDPLDLNSYLHWSGSAPQLWPTCTVQQRLIISPATGQPLAMEMRYQKLPDGKTWPQPGGLFSFEIFGSARWTSTGGPKPGS